MYTTVNQFLAESKKNTGKRINENIYDGPEEMAQPDEMAQPEEMAQPDEMAQPNENELTLDAFKDAYLQKYNEYTAELEEGETAEPVLTDMQLEMIFDVTNSLMSTTDDVEEPEEDMAQPEEMDATVVEEGLGNFFKGGSKEEIQSKKKTLKKELKK